MIHSDKTAYVKGRYIGESVCLISDILENTDNKSIEAILFSADFEKAFDSAGHTFLFSVLKSYGFGPDFIQSVKTLFTNAESCVMHNGHLTGYFPLKRGSGKETSCQRTLHACLRSYVNSVREVYLPTLMILISLHLISGLFWPYLIHVKHFRNSRH